MKNTLTRTDWRADGVFGEFTFEGDSQPFMRTLEHSYSLDDGSFWAKIPTGTYTCLRGIHELHSGPVETFEVLGVLGHTGILCCHVGNYNKDSEGCVLAGKSVIKGNEWMVVQSEMMYEAYMKRLEGIDTFQLEVV